MIGLPCFAGSFCADQDSTDGAASDLETNAGWSSAEDCAEESDDSEPAAAGGTPSRQKQPARVSRVAFGAAARALLHGNVDAVAQVLDAGTHVDGTVHNRCDIKLTPLYAGLVERAREAGVVNIVRSPSPRFEPRDTIFSGIEKPICGIKPLM